MMMIAVRLLLLVIGGRVGYRLLSRNNSPSSSEDLNEWPRYLACCGLSFLGESGVSKVPNYLPSR